VSGRLWRWTEVDPWGHSVSCDEPTWAKKSKQHPELVHHEAEIRATIRDPDRLYHDRLGTFSRSLNSGRNDLRIVHYVAERRAHGRQAGNFISVVVKWLNEAGVINGYVHSMYVPDALQPRLQLMWRRGQ
jgi:hypothetical protein